MEEPLGLGFRWGLMPCRPALCHCRSALCLYTPRPESLPAKVVVYTRPSEHFCFAISAIETPLPGVRELLLSSSVGCPTFWAAENYGDLSPPCHLGSMRREGRIFQHANENPPVLRPVFLRVSIHAFRTPTCPMPQCFFSIRNGTTLASVSDQAITSSRRCSIAGTPQSRFVRILFSHENKAPLFVLGRPSIDSALMIRMLVVGYHSSDGPSWLDLAEIRVSTTESRFADCLNRLLQQNLPRPAVAAPILRH